MLYELFKWWTLGYVFTLILMYALTWVVLKVTGEPTPRGMQRAHGSFGLWLFCMVALYALWPKLVWSVAQHLRKRFAKEGKW